MDIPLDVVSKQLIQMKKNVDELPCVNHTNTILSIFGKEKNENYNSDWLAFLLDPKRNGIGLAPLQALVDATKFELEITETDFNIVREYSFSDKRRLDIYIKTEAYVIAIENKILSGEQTDQTVYYYKSLIKENEDSSIELYCIYLKPSYNPSLPSSNNFNICTYNDLLTEFKKIELHPSIDNNSAFFFYNFIKQMEEHLVGEKELKIDTLSELYLQNKEVINKVKSSYENDCDVVINYLSEKLRVVFPDDSWQTNLPINNKNYIQFYKPEWKNYFIHFELFGVFNNIIDQAFSLDFRIDYETKDRDKKDAFYKQLGIVNNKVAEKITFDFSNVDSIKKSADDICDRLKAMNDKYTKEIVKFINNPTSQQSKIL